MEAGRELLLVRRVRKQVAGELLDREPIERHVGVERVDHPISPRPVVARRVLLEPVGVGIPGRIEPPHRHSLAVTRRRQGLIHQRLVCGGVAHQRGDLFRGRRKPGQVEGDTTREGVWRRRGGGPQAALAESTQDERVHRVRRARRNLGAFWLSKRPMRAPLRAGLDPVPEDRHFVITETGAMRVDRRHEQVFVVGDDPPQSFAGVG